MSMLYVSIVFLVTPLISLTLLLAKEDDIIADIYIYLKRCTRYMLCEKGEMSLASRTMRGLVVE